MTLIQDITAPSAPETTWELRRTDAELVAERRTERSRPRTGATYPIREHSSFQPWLLDPLIVGNGLLAL
jgi:hypothetical protein